MKPIIKTTKVLAGSAVMALAVLAACGGDPGKTTSPAAPERDAAARARLEAQAEQHELAAHLRGQARTHGPPADRQDPVRPNPNEAASRAIAEQHEHSANLEGQARTHSNPDSSNDAPAPAREPSDQEFVPGTHHMPMR